LRLKSILDTSGGTPGPATAPAAGGAGT